mgnify:CR=1 FL=1
MARSNLAYKDENLTSPGFEPLQEPQVPLRKSRPDYLKPVGTTSERLREVFVIGPDGKDVSLHDLRESVEMMGQRVVALNNKNRLPDKDVFIDLKFEADEALRDFDIKIIKRLAEAQGRITADDLVLNGFVDNIIELNNQILSYENSQQSKEKDENIELKEVTVVSPEGEKASLYELREALVAFDSNIEELFDNGSLTDKGLYGDLKLDAFNVLWDFDNGVAEKIKNAGGVIDMNDPTIDKYTDDVIALEKKIAEYGGGGAVKESASAHDGSSSSSGNSAGGSSSKGIGPDGGLGGGEGGEPPDEVIRRARKALGKVRSYLKRIESLERSKDLHMSGAKSALRYEAEGVLNQLQSLLEMGLGDKRRPHLYNDALIKMRGTKVGGTKEGIEEKLIKLEEVRDEQAGFMDVDDLVDEIIDEEVHKEDLIKAIDSLSAAVMSKEGLIGLRLERVDGVPGIELVRVNHEAFKQDLQNFAQLDLASNNYAKLEAEHVESLKNLDRQLDEIMDNLDELELPPVSETESRLPVEPTVPSNSPDVVSQPEPVEVKDNSKLEKYKRILLTQGGVSNSDIFDFVEDLCRRYTSDPIELYELSDRTFERASAEGLFNQVAADTRDETIQDMYYQLERLSSPTTAITHPRQEQFLAEQLPNGKTELKVFDKGLDEPELRDIFIQKIAANADKIMDLLAQSDNDNLKNLLFNLVFTSMQEMRKVIMVGYDFSPKQMVEVPEVLGYRFLNRLKHRLNGEIGKVKIPFVDRVLGESTKRGATMKKSPQFNPMTLARDMALVMVEDFRHALHPRTRFEPFDKIEDAKEETTIEAKQLKPEKNKKSWGKKAAAWGMAALGAAGLSLAADQYLGDEEPAAQGSATTLPGKKEVKSVNIPDAGLQKVATSSTSRDGGLGMTPDFVPTPSPIVVAGSGSEQNSVATPSKKLAPPPSLTRPVPRPRVEDLKPEVEKPNSIRKVKRAEKPVQPRETAKTVASVLKKHSKALDRNLNDALDAMDNVGTDKELVSSEKAQIAKKSLRGNWRSRLGKMGTKYGWQPDSGEAYNVITESLHTIKGLLKSGMSDEAGKSVEELEDTLGNGDYKKGRLILKQMLTRGEYRKLLAI